MFQHFALRFAKPAAGLAVVVGGWALASAAFADAPPATPIFYCPVPQAPVVACPRPGRVAGPVYSAHRAAHRRVAHYALHHHGVRTDRGEEAEVSSSQAWMYRYELTHKGFHPHEEAEHERHGEDEHFSERREAVVGPPVHYEEGHSSRGIDLEGGSMLVYESESEHSSRRVVRRESGFAEERGEASGVGIRRVEGGGAAYTYAGRDDFGYLTWPGKPANLPGH